MLSLGIGAICDMGRADVLKARQNVLSFGVKIGPNGEIKDYKIRTGRVHNVHKLRYADENMVLMNNALSHKLYPFESESMAATTASVDVSSVLPHEGQRRRLYEVSCRLIQERIKRGLFAFSEQCGSLLRRPALPAESNRRGASYPVSWISATSVLRNQFRDCWLWITLVLVAECMKVAGRLHLNSAWNTRFRPSDGPNSMRLYY